MEWRRKYALRSYVRSSMWIVPVVAYLAAMLLIRLLGPVDAWLDWSWAWVVSPRRMTPRQINAATTPEPLPASFAATTGISNAPGQ